MCRFPQTSDLLNLLQQLRFTWAKGVSVDAQHPDSHPQAQLAV